MKFHCLIVVFLIHKCYSFKANHQIERQAKSIFSNKPCKEVFTPARYKITLKNFDYEQPVGNINMGTYFPDVEYPTNILESSKPYFNRMGENILGPFPDDVKLSYKALVEKNMKAFEEMKFKTDSAFNSINCLQDIKAPPQEETIVEPKVVELEATEEIDEEMSGEAQTTMAKDEGNAAIDEMESNETSSESDETIEDIIILQETENVPLENEETILIDDCFQSCESLQFYSNEIKEQLTQNELDEQTDTALERTDGNAIIVDPLESEAENNEASYIEDGLCSVLEPDENNIAFENFNMLDIIKKPTYLNMNKKPFGFRKKPCKF